MSQRFQMAGNAMPSILVVWTENWDLYNKNGDSYLSYTAGWSDWTDTSGYASACLRHW